MNKHLLLGTALLVAISAFPQTGKLVKPSGVLPMTPKKLDFNESTAQNAATFSTPKAIKHIAKPNANKTSASIPSNIFTGSMNVFGYLVSESRPLQYNKDLNAVSFIARKQNTYTPTSNGNSGSIVGLWTTNLGTTWDATCLWANATNLGRYPNGGIYNPSGNTNINNAYLVGVGPITGGTGWLGDFYASKQITTPGNTTAGADQQAHLDATPTIKKHAMSRYAFTTYTVGGIVRSMGNILNDINSTAVGPTGYGLRGAAMVKGTFNAGAFIWSVDSFIPPVQQTTAGTKLLYGIPMQAWDDQGVNGYVIFLGSRSGETVSTNHVNSKGGYQPIVYKTSTSGASWSLLPSNDFSSPYYRAIYDRTYPLNTNTTVIVANFSGTEGLDAVVDVNGMLHLGSMVYGHYYNHVDSLGYRYVFGTEQYSYGETGPFEYPVYYDFTTRPFGGWDYMLIDSMGTEGPSGTSGQPGYGTNPWSDGSGAKMDLDARFQMSRTPDGKKIFYSWTESDSVIVGLKWNEFPDIKWKGYDVTLNKVTPRFDATNSDANLTQGAYYHYMSNRSVATGSCFTIPFTSTKNSGLNGGIDVDTYFLGDEVCPSAFSVTPMVPLGVASANSPVVNFDVFNYPNPADAATTIIIGLKKAENFEVVLYNSVGQILNTYKINGQVGSNEINVDLSSYSAGIYFYNVKVGNSIVTKKLIVQ